MIDLDLDETPTVGRPRLGRLLGRLGNPMGWSKYADAAAAHRYPMHKAPAGPIRLVGARVLLTLPPSPGKSRPAVLPTLYLLRARMGTSRAQQGARAPRRPCSPAQSGRSPSDRSLGTLSGMHDDRPGLPEPAAAARSSMSRLLLEHMVIVSAILSYHRCVPLQLSN